MADPRTHLFANNATCRLGEDLDIGETSITLEGGKGALFPDPGTGEIFVVTIEDLVQGVREIMFCTERSADVLQVERGQEGTDAREWVASNNVVVQHRVTAGTLEHLQESVSEATQSTVIQMACSDLTTVLTSGANRAYVRAPKDFTLNEVRASLLQASSSGPVRVDVSVNGVSILYPLITIDQGEKTSQTAATPPFIEDDEITDDDEITIDIVSEGTGAKGLVVTLKGT
jgi:hypothetical protein